MKQFSLINEAKKEVLNIQDNTINYINADEDYELFLTRDEMYHWLFSLVNCDYGLDNEEFEQFLEE